MHPLNAAALRSTLLAFLFGMALSAYSLIADAREIYLAPHAGQELVYERGVPTVISRKRHSVIVSVATLDSRKAWLSIGIVNGEGNRSINFHEASVKAESSDGRARIIPTKEIIASEKRGQLFKELLAGVVAGANAYYSGQAGQYSETGRFSGEVRRGLERQEFQGTYSARGTDPLAQQRSMERAQESNERMFAALEAEHNARIRMLEENLLFSQTIAPGQIYGGRIQLALPKKSRSAPNAIRVTVNLEGESHSFLLYADVEPPHSVDQYASDSEGAGRILHSDGGSPVQQESARGGDYGRDASPAERSPLRASLSTSVRIEGVQFQYLNGVNYAFFDLAWSIRSSGLRNEDLRGKLRIVSPDGKSSILMPWVIEGKNISRARFSESGIGFEAERLGTATEWLRRADATKLRAQFIPSDSSIESIDLEPHAPDLSRSVPISTDGNRRDHDDAKGPRVDPDVQFTHCQAGFVGDIAIDLDSQKKQGVYRAVIKNTLASAPLSSFTDFGNSSEIGEENVSLSLLQLFFSSLLANDELNENASGDRILNFVGISPTGRSYVVSNGLAPMFMFDLVAPDKAVAFLGNPDQDAEIRVVRGCTVALGEAEQGVRPVAAVVSERLVFALIPTSTDDNGIAARLSPSNVLGHFKGDPLTFANGELRDLFVSVDTKRLGDSLLATDTDSVVVRKAFEFSEVADSCAPELGRLSAAFPSINYSLLAGSDAKLDSFVEISTSRSVGAALDSVVLPRIKVPRVSDFRGIELGLYAKADGLVAAVKEAQLHLETHPLQCFGLEGLKSFLGEMGVALEGLLQGGVGPVIAVVRVDGGSLEEISTLVTGAFVYGESPSPAGLLAIASNFLQSSVNANANIDVEGSVLTVASGSMRSVTANEFVIDRDNVDGIALRLVFPGAASKVSNGRSTASNRIYERTVGFDNGRIVLQASVR